MLRRSLRLSPLGLAALLVAACADTPALPPPDATSDDAFAVMERLDASAIADAYERLSELPHTATLRLEQLDTNGEVTATHTRTVRRLPTESGFEETVIDTESSGETIDAEDLGALSITDPTARLLPDDPAYLNLRTREHYVYALRDTTLGSTPLRVAEARLFDVTNDAMPVRLARYLLDGDAVTGLTVERLSTSALFDEDSRATVFLTDGPSGPLPAEAVSETTVDVPGADPRRLRLTQIVSLEETQ